MVGYPAPVRGSCNLQPQGQVAILLQERRGRQPPGRVQAGTEPPAVRIRREGGVDAVQTQAEAFQPRGRGGPAGFRIVNPVFLDAAGLVKRPLVLHRLLVVGMRDVALPRGGGQDFQHQFRRLVPRHDVRAGARRLAGRTAQVEEHVRHGHALGTQIEVHLPVDAEPLPPARVQMAVNDGDRLPGDVAVDGTVRPGRPSAGVLLFGPFAGRQGARARAPISRLLPGSRSLGDAPSWRPPAHTLRLVPAGAAVIPRASAERSRRAGDPPPLACPAASR